MNGMYPFGPLWRAYLAKRHSCLPIPPDWIRVNSNILDLQKQARCPFATAFMITSFSHRPPPNTHYPLPPFLFFKRLEAFNLNNHRWNRWLENAEYDNPQAVWTIPHIITCNLFWFDFFKSAGINLLLQETKIKYFDQAVSPWRMATIFSDSAHRLNKVRKLFNQRILIQHQKQKLNQPTQCMSCWRRKNLPNARTNADIAIK